MRSAKGRMVMAVVWLGAAPAGEGLTADDSPDAGLRLCRRYQAAVRLVVGEEPPGAVLRVLPAPPDRPHPFELACEYDPADLLAADYAARCRTDAPTTWAAAGLSPPDFASDRGRG